MVKTKVTKVQKHTSYPCILKDAADMHILMVMEGVGTVIHSVDNNHPLGEQRTDWLETAFHRATTVVELCNS